tara:strand:- start:74 stop:2119 length:2046 start_codon:yes stop_codon:yes gene_type:complete
MPKTKVPALKNIPNKIDRELKDTLESMKEAQEVRLGRRGDPLDRAITLRELIDSGLAKQLRNRPFDPNGLIDFIPNDDTVGDLTIPPAPTGLEASGAFTEIIVDWNPAQYSNHAFTEVWRSRDDEIGTAVLITTTASFIITDPVGYDQTYFYWVRFVSTSNVRGPFNQTNGTRADTVENIGAVMQQLSEELSNLPGFNLMSTIATAATVIRSSNEPSARNDSSAIQVNDIWFDTDDGQVYTRNSANSAWVASRDATLVTLVGASSFTGSTISSALSTAQSDIVTVTNAQSATASSLTSLTSTVTSNNNTLTASINSEATTRANADTALTNSVNNLTSTVNGNSSSISTLSTTTASHTGDLNAMFVLTVATESNGSKSAAGMVVGSNASNGSGAQSFVQFQADKFAIWNNTNASVAPFIVSGGSVFIDSARIQDGAITNARIADGTIQSAKIGTAAITSAKIGDLQVTTAKIADANITTAKIGNAQITNAKINDLSADKINAGFLSADRIDSNTITADKINVTNLVLPISRGTVSSVGPFNNNTMRLIHVADIGTATGIYSGYVRIFGSNGQVKTLSVVIGDGSYGAGSSFDLRSDFAYQNNVNMNVPIADSGSAQYHSGQSQFWSAIDRFNSTSHMVQLDVSVRKTSSTSSTMALYILAQGDGNFRFLSSVQFAFYRFSEA